MTIDQFCILLWPASRPTHRLRPQVFSCVRHGSLSCATWLSSATKGVGWDQLASSAGPPSSKTFNHSVFWWAGASKSAAADWSHPTSFPTFAIFKILCPAERGVADNSYVTINPHQHNARMGSGVAKSSPGDACRAGLIARPCKLGRRSVRDHIEVARSLLKSERRKSK